MDKFELAGRAAELKSFKGYNCAQAVTAVLADETNLEEKQLNMLASGFALGMGNMEATCGSLIGAVMIAGLKTNGQGAVRCAKAISERFKSMCGSVTCKALKGRENPDIFCPCDQCVRNAVIAYCDVMGKN